jgi:large subunit ribosomal protein L5
MNFIENYYKNIIKYDLLNRFQYKNLKKLPRLKKIILSFSCKNSNTSQIMPSLLALELITSQKALLTLSKNSNISLKIRKGNPVGCKVILKKKVMYNFLKNLILNILPNLVKFKKNSLTLENSLVFSELEQQYYLFKDIPKLNISIVCNSVNFIEFFFLLNSFKLPINKKSL